MVRLVESFELCPHLYADDTQIYGFCRPGATDSLRNRVADCVAAVADWMESNRETSFLYQRVSVLIQRYNAVLLHDSLPTTDRTD